MRLIFTFRSFVILVVSIAIIGLSNVAFSQSSDEDPDPIVLFGLGQDAHEKNEFAKALEFYKKALAISPEFPEAEFQSGNALASLGRNEEAEQAFRRAVELRPDWPLAFTQLGTILVRNNRFEEASKILARAINLDDRNFPAYVALTELRLRTKAAPNVLKELLTRLEFLSSQLKSNSLLLGARGAIERALGNLERAKINLERSIELDNRNTFALSERIELALTEGDSARAVADSKTLVAHSSNSVSSKLLLARAYSSDGNDSEALKILDTLDAKNPLVANLRTSILVNTSTDFERLEKEIENDPRNVVVLARLCSAFRISNPSKALNYCRRASEVEPSNISHAVGYGSALVQAREFASAVGLFRRILQTAPDNYTAHSNLATALFQLKRFDEAKTEYQWLITIKPDLAIAYYLLAISHDSLAEYVDALANYQQFLRLADPKLQQLEIDKVNLRLPILQRQIKKGDGKRPR